MKNYDFIICGAGLAGCVAARALADRQKSVLLIEKLPHIGGSVFDFINSDGVLVHKYGPHIFHTNNKDVFVFLSRFTEWNGYSHKVVANLVDFSVPVPFNLTSLRTLYGSEKAQKLEKLLKDEFFSPSVSILSLMQSKNPELADFGNTVYEKIFLIYTMKQWGKKPSEIDPTTTSRVPVRLTEDDRYFTDVYQGLPSISYSEMLQNMIDSPLITVMTNTDFFTKVSLNNSNILLNGKPFGGKVIYTGQIERLFDFSLGALPYRTLDFVFETHETDSYQSHATVNYTVSEDFTRISEFKKMTLQNINGVTTILKEFPKEYDPKTNDIPFYPVNCPESKNMYEKYLSLSEKYKKLFLLGRLAEYKYYNMDAVVAQALNLCSELCSD